MRRYRVLYSIEELLQRQFWAFKSAMMQFKIVGLILTVANWRTEKYVPWIVSRLSCHTFGSSYQAWSSCCTSWWRKIPQTPHYRTIPCRKFLRTLRTVGISWWNTRRYFALNASYPFFHRSQQVWWRYLHMKPNS